jgi:mannose-6-phosphate isomerase-like protein (cupin superfamily)
MPKFETIHVNKPWGGETIFAHNERYVGKILFIKEGHRLSKQYHKVKDETIFVMEGRLQLEIGEGDDKQIAIMRAGDAYHITPGTVHRFCAYCNQNVRLFEVSTPELDDVVRLEDDYDREVLSFSKT